MPVYSLVYVARPCSTLLKLKPTRNLSTHAICELLEDSNESDDELGRSELYHDELNKDEEDAEKRSVSSPKDYLTIYENASSSPISTGERMITLQVLGISRQNDNHKPIV